MLPITTCKDCRDRHVGCHSTCQKYLTARAEKEREKEWLYPMRNAKADFDDFKYKTVEATKRRYRR